MTNVISFQGEPGAYSHQACVEMFPKMEALPCNTFEGAVAAVKEGRAELAMLPVENSTYGRVADIHHLLPDTGLHIVGEHFVRVHIDLLAVPGTKIEQVKHAMSHTVLLGQCRGFLKEHAILPRTGADTAGSAKVSRMPRSPKSRLWLPVWRAKFTGWRLSPRISRTTSTTPPVSSLWHPNPNVRLERTQ